MADKNSDEYFKERYNTNLSADDEAKYQAWLKDRSAKQGRDLSKDEIDYDLRGFWKSGAATADNGHGTDEYKKPNHPTFSNESKYHGSKDESGTTNIGGEWVEKDGKTQYKQSDTNKKYWPEWAIEDYLTRVEPDVTLLKKKE